MIEPYLKIMNDGAAARLVDLRREQVDVAVICLSIVSSHSGWRYSSPLHRAGVEKRLVESFESIVYWADCMMSYAPNAFTNDKWTGRRIGLERKPGLELQTVGRTADIMYNMLSNSKSLREAVSRYESFLKLALLFWLVTVPGGKPAINPAARPPSQLVTPDHTDEPTALFHWANAENPEVMAKLILDGTLCSPEEFVQRTMRRMICFAKVNTIPHLSHFPDVTLETRNFQCVAFSIGTLMANKPLSSLFSDVGAPEILVKILVDADSKFLSARKAKVITQARCAELMGDNLFTTGRVAAMVLQTDGFRPMRHVHNIFAAGILSMLGNCMSTCNISQLTEGNAPMTAIFGTLGGFCVFPKIFRLLHHDLHRYIVPNSSVLRKDPQSLAQLDGTVRRADAWAQYMPKDARVKVCDNSLHVAEAARGSPKTCSRCHSVVYCSRQCQREDWRSRHRDECHHMYEDYLERKHTDTSYSHHTRAFQLSLLLHVYETAMCTSPTWANEIRANKVVKIMDPTRPVVESVFEPLKRYLKRVRPFVPKFKMKRFDDLIEMFDPTYATEADGVVALRTPGTDPHNPGELSLVHSIIQITDIEINFIVLFRRVRTTTSNGGFEDFMSRDARVGGSDFEVLQFVWFYNSPAQFVLDKLLGTYTGDSWFTS
ncbi:hypothetical protein DFP72DRAFT_1074112 [Ephemerocybe angulata]|uniref:MYND-type domain-containing protein n=1 Tax=Ephemerocybe angulata TaxID=980116 RepID=A0A8H6HK36_9AGAR|nr:hypothetical protein DFP72DRAFT_1074112 [Tulosesus angulatus]